MVRIAIPCRRYQVTDSLLPVESVRPPYLKAVTTYGGIPFLIPLLNDEESIRKLYDLSDGVIIPGGEDVNPELYFEPKHEKLGKVDDDRDRVESLLIKWAKKDKKPLLGICRGVQVMNVALGGSLYQDIGSETTTIIDHNSKHSNALIHSIEIAKGSQLAMTLQTEELKVNSLHHQAIKKISSDLIVNSLSEDGLIEGVEMPSHPFFIGVQCHPELLFDQVDIRWGKLFNSFIKACK